MPIRERNSAVNIIGECLYTPTSPWDMTSNRIEREISTCLIDELGEISSSIDNVYIKEKKENIEYKNNDIKKCCICNSTDNIISSYEHQSKICLCKKCFDENIVKCINCKQYYGKDEAIDKTCLSCLSVKNNLAKCKNCQKWLPYREVIKIRNSFSYCKECIGSLGMKIFTCKICGTTFKYDRYAKENTCISCLNYNLKEVKNYSYKPEPRFFSKTNELDNLYIGVELEMGEVDDSNVVNDFVAEYANSFFYMKKDTSIPFYGCEIVTQPATLGKHINSKYWRTLLQTAEDYGFNANHEHCGVHVHISRNVLNNNELACLDYFVNTFNIWKKIARRESHYSAYINKEDDSWGTQTTNRRCALNLSNENTIEFRIFKGTLKYEYIMAYIEACHAATKFVKCITYENFIKEKKWVIEKFKDFIYNNKYEFLPNYCEEFDVFNESN